jgi:hypothetical protein
MTASIYAAARFCSGVRTIRSPGPTRADKFISAELVEMAAVIPWRGFETTTSLLFATRRVLIGVPLDTGMLLLSGTLAVTRRVPVLCSGF